MPKRSYAEEMARGGMTEERFHWLHVMADSHVLELVVEARRARNAEDTLRTEVMRLHTALALCGAVLPPEANPIVSAHD